jgi:hypothetical protein
MAGLPAIRRIEADQKMPIHSQKIVVSPKASRLPVDI